MNCIICNKPMSFYFRKHFGEYNLSDVDYWICHHCGFVASKTHFDMTDEQWAVLNCSFHEDNNRRSDNPYNRNQRYFNQALMLYLISRHDLFPVRPWLDWGCGMGSLSMQLRRHFNIDLLNFDKFIRPQINQVQEYELIRGGYGLVVNTAVFEHVRNRSTLDEIESYVSENGCLGVHTLVHGEIPKDPDWMYLLPVHCAFYTNMSVQLIMNAWGYRSSVYNEHSKMWVMFRQAPHLVQKKVSELNRSLGWEYLHYKEGFMDYWP